MSVDDFLKTFNINGDTSDVIFKAVEMEPYVVPPQNKQFGEKKSVLYRINLVVFNINISIRVLAFKYKTHAEVLKLEIQILDELFMTEMAPCKNFLQRKRNMNLAFNLLIKFAKLFEMRRLICVSVFEKEKCVKVKKTDSGLSVTFYKPNTSIKYLDLSWSIMWKVDNLEITDFIEFYFNYKTIGQALGDQVKEKLCDLVQSDWEFHKKLKLWKSVMEYLYENNEVLEISDSEDEESVVIIDKKEDYLIID